MTIWRSRQRYEANRRVGELADDALLSITLLSSRAEGTPHPDWEKTESGLHSGISLLETLRLALENPEESTTTEYALAQTLRRDWGQLRGDAIDRLDRYVTLLSRAADERSYFDDLSDVERTLKKIDRLSTEKAQKDADYLRENLAK